MLLMPHPESHRPKTAAIASGPIRRSRMSVLLFDALDDAHIAFAGLFSKGCQRLAVARAVIGGERLFQAGKFDEHRALLKPLFHGAFRHAACEDAPALRCERGGGEF